MVNSNKTHRASFINARITATISVTLVLLLIGIISLLGIAGYKISNNIRENIGFNIYFTTVANNEQIAAVDNMLKKSTFVHSKRFVSKEEALKEITEELGENPQDILGVNPLSASFEVNVKHRFAHVDSLNKIKKIYAAMPAVEEVVVKEELVNGINENISRVTMVLSVILVILMFISFMLINSTIHLMAHSKRFTIHTMKLVGAKPSFIRRPFIIHNMITGIFAAIIAIAMMFGGVLYFNSYIESDAGIISWNDLTLVSIALVLLGVILCSLAAYIAIGRYIRMRYDELF